MAKMELAARTEPDRENVYLEMRMDGVPLGHMFLTASDAENHIHGIAKHRAELVDEVSRELDPGSRIEAVVDPIWRTPKSSLDQQGVVLVLRHPGLGWLSFLFPHNEAAALGRWLVDHSKPPVPDNKSA